MQTIDAHTSCASLEKSRQLTHAKAKTGHYVRVRIVGDVQIMDGNKFANAKPVTKFLWAPIDQVLAIKDLRPPIGRPRKKKGEQLQP